MRKAYKIGVLLFCILLLNTSALLAQSKEWKNATSKDETIATKYRLSTRSDENGKEVPLIESVTTTTAKLSLDQCIALMKNVSKHKDFHSDNASRILETISDDKWIIYYYTDGTFFTPDADGVYTMTLTEEPGETASFEIGASPDLMEPTDARRFTYLTKGYSFENLNDGTVEITMTTNLSPAFKVPGWIIRMAFPHVFFDVMQKFIKLAQDE